MAMIRQDSGAGGVLLAFVAANLVVIALVVGLAPDAGALIGLVIAVPLLVLGVRALVIRPQRGVLLLAALLPFDGLLVLFSFPEWVDAWKEALVLATLAATFVAPLTARSRRGSSPPSWWPMVLVFVGLGVASAILHPEFQSLVGLKVTFFYVLIAVIVWRCPLDRRERDGLVSILMALGLLTALIGLGQQVLGPDRLAELGWQYNENIRFAGGILRSFSTFNQNFPFALFLMLVLLVGIPCALVDRHRRRNRWFLLSIPIIVLALAFTVTRAAWLGLLVGLLYLGMSQFRSLLSVVVRGALVAIVVLLVAGGFATTFLSEESSKERVEIWRTNIDQIPKQPFGQGIGSTGSAAEKAAELSGSTEEVVTPDNYYFKIALELGVLGLWAVVVLLVAAFSAAHCGAARLAGQDAAFARATAAMVLAAAAISATASYFEVFPLDAYFWMFLGIVAACVRESD